MSLYERLLLEKRAEETAGWTLPAHIGGTPPPPDKEVRLMRHSAELRERDNWRTLL